jgi:glyoxylase-like metal-dependent hydrolase (beta-lactamase superfamily II)
VPTEEDWIDLAGSRARLLSLERKPDVLCCNAYLLESPSFLLVVDPGADEEQTLRLARLLGGLRHHSPRPVLAFLTHAHRDHALALADLSATGGFPVTVMAHGPGADALEQGDAHYTHSDLTGKSFPCIPVGYRLFTDAPPPAGAAGETTPAGPLTPLLRQRLTFGPGEVLDVFPTPGHSPDSCSLRAGDSLFVGDVLSAAAPGVAGKVGWSQSDLSASLAGLVELLEHEEIAVCRPGHGWSVPVEKALPALRSAQRKVATMTNLALLDRDRARFLGRYARVLLKRALVVFTIIAAKLLSLSYWLERLEESEEAARMQKLLDMDSVESFFDDFQQFVDEFVEGSAATAVPLKGVQVVKRIEKVFDEEGLVDVLNPLLLRSFRHLMTDYVNAVQGFQFEDYGRPEDLNALLAEAVDAARRTAVTAEEFLDSSDDPGDFLRQLSRRLAYRPLFESVDLRLESDGALPPVSVDRDRLVDVFVALLDQLAAGKASFIRIGAYQQGGRACAAFTAGGSVPGGGAGGGGSGSGAGNGPTLARDQLDYYRLTMELYGGAFREAEHDGVSALVFELPAVGEASA